MSRVLELYLWRFTHLKVDRSKGRPAPHKPILLLAVIQGIENGEIVENRICITAELVARFKDLFRQFGGSFVPNFSLPFYHLKTSGFWHLHTVTGREILLTKSLSIRSFAHLLEVVAYADFDEDLFILLMDEHARTLLKHCLLQAYFKEQLLPERESKPLLESVRDEILNEPPAVYRKKVEFADEEELFVRGSMFKKVIPQVYGYTCCISGMCIISTRDVQMIDACHIVPFAKSHDDTVANGISLCPNLHRAFDRFLISVDNECRVTVSESFVEQNGNYSIKSLQGSKIYLPSDPKHHPDRSNLNWHYQQFLACN